MDPVTIATIGSLLFGFFGNRKKNKEAVKVNATNTANEQDYKTKLAARQDAIDQGSTSVANQTSAAEERNRIVRNQMAQAILKTLQPDTIDKDITSAALMSNASYKPVTYTAPPPNVVSPATVQADPGTGMIYDSLSKILSGIASSQIEKQKAEEYKKTKASVKSGSNLEWKAPDEFRKLYENEMGGQ